jgi:hypothetical protein
MYVFPLVFFRIIFPDYAFTLPLDRDPITAYLDLPEVRSLLGVSSKVGNFTSCSPKVGAAFHAALDSAEWTWLYVAGLLERGVEVVSYVGTNDCESGNRFQFLPT